MSYVSAKARQEFKVMNENEIKMTKKNPNKKLGYNIGNEWIL